MSAPIQNTADSVELTPDDRNDAYCAVVSDIVSLIARVQTSRRLIERAIARETSLNGQESSANVIVLDDVSPRYMKATAALQVCDASLGAALHSLTDSGSIGAYAANAPAPATIGA
jgi:hypothetical protein